MTLINLALRFLLELAGIAAVAIAGYRLAAASPLAWLSAGTGAALFIVAWALIVAPKAANGLSQGRKDLIGTGLLLAAAAALAVAGWIGPAVGFGALVIVNASALIALGPDPRHRLMDTAR